MRKTTNRFAIGIGAESQREAWCNDAIQFVQGSCKIEPVRQVMAQGIGQVDKDAIRIGGSELDG